MKHTATQQYFATIKKNKEDLHKLIWNSLQDRLLSEKAKCKKKKMYLWLYYTSCKKKEAIRKHSCSCSFVQKKYSKPKPETKEIGYLVRWTGRDGKGSNGKK